MFDSLIEFIEDSLPDYPYQSDLKDEKHQHAFAPDCVADSGFWRTQPRLTHSYQARADV